MLGTLLQCLQQMSSQVDSRGLSRGDGLKRVSVRKVWSDLSLRSAKITLGFYILEHLTVLESHMFMMSILIVHANCSNLV